MSSTRTSRKHTWASGIPGNLAAPPCDARILPLFALVSRCGDRGNGVGCHTSLKIRRDLLEEKDAGKVPPKLMRPGQAIDLTLFSKLDAGAYVKELKA